MPEVTNELMYEVLKHLQERMIAFERKIDEVKSELQALPIHSLAIQQDTQNIYSMLTRHDTRFDRIERRPGLLEKIPGRPGCVGVARERTHDPAAGLAGRVPQRAAGWRRRGRWLAAPRAPPAGR